MADDPVDKAEEAAKTRWTRRGRDPKSPEPALRRGEHRPRHSRRARVRGGRGPEPSGLGDPDPPPSREDVDRVLILNEVAGGRKLVNAARELADAGASPSPP